MTVRPTTAVTAIETARELLAAHPLITAEWLVDELEKRCGVRPADFQSSTTVLTSLIGDIQSMHMSSRDETARMPYDEAKDIAWELLRGYDREAREVVGLSFQAKGRIVVSYKTALPVRGTLTYVHKQGDPA